MFLIKKSPKVQLPIRDAEEGSYRARRGLIASEPPLTAPVSAILL